MHEADHLPTVAAQFAVGFMHGFTVRRAIGVVQNGPLW
jgi:hypothetical protein